MRAIAISVIFLCLAGPAAAERWQSFQDQTSRGAGICPVNDAETGNFFCLTFACQSAAQPPEIAITFAGGELVGGPYSLEVFVDNAPAGRVALRPAPGRGVTRLAAPYRPAQDAPLVTALSRGQSAILKLNNAGQALFHGITLSGSARALAAFQALCPALPSMVAPPKATGLAPLPGAEAGAGTLADGPLSAAEVSSSIVGRQLFWGDDQNGVGTVYGPNGRFDGVMVNDGRGRANNGTWELMPDGRICWQSVASGCFRFFRRGGAVFVRRDDAKSQSELGQVIFQ